MKMILMMNHLGAYTDNGERKTAQIIVCKFVQYDGSVYSRTISSLSSNSLFANFLLFDRFDDFAIRHL